MKVYLHELSKVFFFNIRHHSARAI